MKKILAMLLSVVMIFSLAAGLVGCTDDVKTFKKADDSLVTTLTNLGTNIKVGVILIGDAEEGYTAAHIDGIRAAIAELSIPEANVTFKYNVPETEAAYDEAKNLVNAGCNIIFANSFGHETYMIKAAKEFKNVLFFHATGQTANEQQNEGVHNIFNYFTNVYESRYVSGVVAGIKLEQLIAENKIEDINKDANGNIKIGYVGAYNFAEVVSGYTAFYLGVKSVVSNVVMEVKYTNSWFDITAEANAADQLMEKGCIIIGQHADSNGAPGAVQTAAASGKTVFCVGYNIDMISIAPDAVLTSAQNVWSICYKNIIEKAMKGEKVKINTSYGYKDDGVKISDLNTDLLPEDTAARVETVVNNLKNGTVRVFDTSKFTVDGKTLTSYDKSYGFDGVELIWDGYFHESEIIAAPLFDIRIDGITEFSAAN